MEDIYSPSCHSISVGIFVSVKKKNEMGNVEEYTGCDFQFSKSE